MFEPPKEIKYETRDILDEFDNIIGTLTLPDTTTETEWEEKLNAIQPTSLLPSGKDKIIEIDSSKHELLFVKNGVFSQEWLSKNGLDTKDVPFIVPFKSIITDIVIYQKAEKKFKLFLHEIDIADKVISTKSPIKLQLNASDKNVKMVNNGMIIQKNYADNPIILHTDKKYALYVEQDGGILGLNNFSVSILIKQIF